MDDSAEAILRKLFIFVGTSSLADIEEKPHV
jgi:hypothetical protein